MLQYRQNVNYGQSQTFALDDQLSELNQLCSQGVEDYELYLHIRQYIYREIKIRELAVTVILEDLEAIRKRSARAAQIITMFICHNDRSYSEVASMFGVSKQLIHQTIKKHSTQYQWLKNLIQIKGQQDAKNGNNRQVFFSGKKQVYLQTDLFEQLAKTRQNGEVDR